MSTPTSTAVERPPLLRLRSGATPGVATGLAQHLGWSVTATRWAFVLMSIVVGAGIALYLWFWLALPVRRGDEHTERLILRLPTAALSLGASGVATAVALFAGANDATLRDAGIAMSAWTVIPGIVPALVFAIASMAWSLIIDRNVPSRSGRYSRFVRIGTASVLVICSLGVLSSRPAAATAIISVVMLIIGAGLFVFPTLVFLWTDLIDERSARARDGERAEIAAHLHDSVMQTLALIQRRAEPGTEIARIARAQERELRSWLFGGESAPAGDLTLAITDDASDIELAHPVRIDVVASGDTDSLPELTSSTVRAATREALLNAARHAGGDVSVYIERGAQRLTVYVRDRGPGIILDDVPSDRLGIRESIIGRMRRIGGYATVEPGRGDEPSGTEVTISVEVPQ